MTGITRGALCALIGAAALACGDDGDGAGGGGGSGGGSGGAPSGAVTSTAVTTTQTASTAASSSSGGQGGDTGSGGQTGSGGGTTGSGGNGGGGGSGGASSCGSIAIEGDAEPGGTLGLTASLAEDLGDPDLPDRIDVGYAEEEGDFDLASVVNDNLATCEQCVVVYEDVDEAGVPARIYFQSAGQMGVAEDADGFPFVEISFSDVELVEVTVDEDGVSIPVERGACLTLGDTSVEYLIPEAWTCTASFYADSAGCDCNCGAYDPDCDDATQAIIGCPFGAVCGETGLCVPPQDWSCEDDAFGDGETCDCECGVVDPDCNTFDDNPVVGCETDEICDAQGQCLFVPPEWTCNGLDYAASNGCDCECGVYDPDCDLPGAFVLGCEPGEGCTAEATCGVPATWTCEDAAWNDGTTCDCDCGAPDPDCADDQLAVVGCEGEEVCAGGSCVVPAGNDTCADAIPLVEGTVNGNWLDTTNDYDPGAMGCATGYAQVGGDVVYSLSLEAGQDLVVTIAASAADSALYLLTDCDEPVDSCVAGVDARVLQGETLEYTAPVDQDLFLIVDQFANTDEVPFTLQVAID